MKLSFFTQEAFSQILTYRFVIQFQAQISKHDTQDKDAHGNLVECIKFTSWDGYNIFCDSKTMGSFLPDVASSGLEIIKIDEPEPQKKQNSIEKYCAGKTTPTHEIEKSF